MGNKLEVAGYTILMEQSFNWDKVFTYVYQSTECTYFVTDSFSKMLEKVDSNMSPLQEWVSLIDKDGYVLATLECTCDLEGRYWEDIPEEKKKIWRLDIKDERIS